MVVATHRPSRVLIDESAIYNNVTHAVADLDDSSALFAVIKADAYGHGLLRVARIALAAGATGFCVAVLDEALGLREAGYTQPILVLGIIEPQYAELAAQHDIAVPVAERDWLQKAAKSLTGELPLKVHTAVDTGMGRIGFTSDADLRAAADYMQAHADKFNHEGIFTHFATADSLDKTQFHQQATRFNQFVAALPVRPKYVHVANTATSLWHRACHSNIVRFGVGIYGLNPSGREISQTPYALQPALSLESALTQCKHVPAGTTISYGATYVSAAPEYIGTVPMGYADGWLRRMQGFHVLVDGHECEMVGRVCMDQFMIRLPHAYPAGTKVVLIGKSGGKEITLQDAAEYAGTIHYEIACCLSERLPRVSINKISES
ncbi:alanine racemase [Lacticaseibacillus pabuli]|uniref:Alanine racemase n=1 Tax=Lacticaseibacillus pabuli TaxID=3025672 RepID=A0ABY7WS83_9LACO|nr:alanine racemase [Lacticaseibacillus sp. KACC 23028]WDF83043.1 alanine racemase [Lacticaseibacillus sp. KACC 23028]